MLTDVHGPRLTGSPNLKAAGEWAIEQMHAWGLKNGHLEPWDFGYPGWTNERLAATSCRRSRTRSWPRRWRGHQAPTGAVRGAALQMTLPRRPTQEELAAHLDTLKDWSRERWCLCAPQQVQVTFNPAPLRREDRDVITQMTAAAPAGRAGGPRRRRPAGQQTPGRRPLTANQLDEQLNAFLVANGVLVRINDAGRDHGQIRAFDNRTFDLTKAPPTVVMRNEDYGRIWRLLDDKRPVELEFDIVNRTYPEGRTSYNVIAEIPGSDKADEVVMLGGHLDSWHAATGATDNAIGCAVMMEAARILVAIGVKPRRTIRVGAVERGRAGSARLTGVRSRTVRHLRGTQAGVCKARGLLQHRQRHRPRARLDGLRPTGGRDCAA